MSNKQLAQQQFEQSEIFAYLNKELVQKSRAVAVLEVSPTVCLHALAMADPDMANRGTRRACRSWSCRCSRIKRCVCLLPQLGPLVFLA
eukprot:3938933-Rhodomonas_salina.2